MEQLGKLGGMGLEKGVGLIKTEGTKEFWNLKDIFFVCYTIVKIQL